MVELEPALSEELVVLAVPLVDVVVVLGLVVFLGFFHDCASTEFTKIIVQTANTMRDRFIFMGFKN